MESMVEDKHKAAFQYQEDVDGPTNLLTADTLRRINMAPSKSTESLGCKEESGYGAHPRTFLQDTPLSEHDTANLTTLSQTTLDHPLEDLAALEREAESKELELRQIRAQLAAARQQSTTTAAYNPDLLSTSHSNFQFSAAPQDGRLRARASHGDLTVHTEPQLGATSRKNMDPDDMTIFVKGMGSLTIGGAQLDIQDGAEIPIRTNESERNLRDGSNDASSEREDSRGRQELKSTSMTRSYSR